jgi:hypothetical protein
MRASFLLIRDISAFRTAAMLGIVDFLYLRRNLPSKSLDLATHPWQRMKSQAKFLAQLRREAKGLINHSLECCPPPNLGPEYTKPATNASLLCQEMPSRTQKAQQSKASQAVTMTGSNTDFYELTGFAQCSQLRNFCPCDLHEPRYRLLMRKDQTGQLRIAPIQAE